MDNDIGFLLELLKQDSDDYNILLTRIALGLDVGTDAENTFENAGKK